jgi:hypothetical protein
MGKAIYHEQIRFPCVLETEKTFVISLLFGLVVAAV